MGPEKAAGQATRCCQGESNPHNKQHIQTMKMILHFLHLQPFGCFQMNKMQGHITGSDMFTLDCMAGCVSL